MLNTEQILSTAIGELRCLSPDRPASLDELTALRAARDCVDELLRSCVAELRANAQMAPSWADIAYALDAPSPSAARQLYVSKRSIADEHVRSFWEELAERFTWDFLPVGFLYALYAKWMSVEFPKDTRYSKETFSRRLKTTATASGEWVHTRSRPGSLMDAPEPLTKLLPDWDHDGSNTALYGFRRSGAALG